MKLCTKCNNKVPDGKSHFCRNLDANIGPDSDFLISLAVGAATDSVAAGFLAGGSLTGAIIGEALNDDDNDHNDDSDCEPDDDDSGDGD